MRTYQETIHELNLMKHDSSCVDKELNLLSQSLDYAILNSDSDVDLNNFSFVHQIKFINTSMDMHLLKNKLIDLGYEIANIYKIDDKIQITIRGLQQIDYHFFDSEIDLIQNQNLKNIIISVLSKVPQDYFTIPASSTGKYHPQYAQGYQGLIRHVKAAVLIAKELLNNKTFLQAIYGKKKVPENINDLVYTALLLHDSVKLGLDENKKNTKFEHPDLAAEFFINSENISLIPKKDVEIIEKAIRQHMGEWNTSKYSNNVLETPNNEISYIVHICDYLASRKLLEVNFDNI